MSGSEYCCTGVRTVVGEMPSNVHETEYACEIVSTCRAHRFMDPSELEVAIRDKVNMVAIALIEDDIDLGMDRLACIA